MSRPVVFKAAPESRRFHYVLARRPWIVWMPFGHQTFHRTWAEALEAAVVVADEIARGEVPC